MLPVDKTIEGLAGALSLLQRRHEVLVSNVANLETPGYRARELDFGDALKAAFVHQERPPAVPRAEVDANAPARADGNSVDIDLQMAKLGQNGGRYVSLAKIMSMRLALLRLAMEGSR
jgi:flagellar basal-body rod protein FlgB